MSKVIFELVVQDVNLSAELVKQKALVKDLAKELLGIEKGTVKERELAEQIGKTRAEIIKLTAEQKALNKEFAATQVPKDSLAGLRLEYSKLTDQITKLSRAEREADFGKRLIANANGIKGEINKIEESVGRFTGSVGNYKQARLQLADLITGGLATGGIVVALSKVIEITKIGISETIKYEKALDRLQALTGVTDKELEGFKQVEESLRSIQVKGEEIVNTGTDITNALTLVGSARPELLKSAEGLGEVTKQAIILQKASGDSLDASVKALTTTMGQFNAEAGDAGKLVNELAAGAKVGSAEIPDITQALAQFGAVAKLTNVSTSESIALIETLAKSKIPIEQIGTQSRNILTDLASAEALPRKAQAAFAKFGIDPKVLADQTLTLTERLTELQKLKGDIPALKAIFGKENLLGAAVLSTNVATLEELRMGIINTSEALDQAAINADNTSTALLNLKNKALNQLQKDFQDGSPLIKSFAESLGSLSDNGVLSFLLKFTNQLSLAFNAVQLIRNQIKIVSGEARTSGFLGFLKGDILPDVQKATSLDFETSLGIPNKETSKSVLGLTPEEKTAALLKKIEAEGDNVSEKNTKNAKKKKEEDLGAIDSLRSLEKAVRDITDQIEKAPADAKILDPLVAKLVFAEARLKALKSRLDEIRNPDKRSEQDRANAGFSELGDSPTVEVDRAKSISTEIIDVEKSTDEQVLELRRSLTEASLELTRTEAAEKKRLAEEEIARDKERRKQIFDAAVDSAYSIAGALTDISIAKQQQEQTLQEQALEAEFQKRRDAAAGNAPKLVKIEKDYQKRKLELEKQSAEERRKIALKEAIIQGALAIIKALATGNYFAAIAAGIATALQIAVINKQTFAKGGAVKSGTFGGKSHAQGGTQGHFDDGTFVEVEKDEDFIILNKAASFERKRLSNLNSRFGGRRFAAGGSLDFTPQIAVPSASPGTTLVVTAQAAFTDDQIRLMAREIATQNAIGTRQAIGEGLNDNNRLQERKAAAAINSVI